MTLFGFFLARDGGVGTGSEEHVVFMGTMGATFEAGSGPIKSRADAF